MSNYFRDIIRRAAAQAESVRAASIRKSYPDAIPEEPKSQPIIIDREALVAEEEIRRRTQAEAQRYLEDNQPVDWAKVGETVRTWQRVEASFRHDHIQKALDRAITQALQKANSGNSEP